MGSRLAGISMGSVGWAWPGTSRSCSVDPLMCPPIVNAGISLAGTARGPWWPRRSWLGGFGSRASRRSSRRKTCRTRS
eukprot:7408270-Pyramimonas_sp.AAC.1